MLIKIKTRKLIAVILAAVMAVLCLPVGVSAAIGGDTIAAYSDADDSRYLLPVTEEELANDPGAWRLSGRMALDEEDDAPPAEGSTEGSSPFISGVYTHDDAHDRYVILNGVDVSSYQKEIDWEKARRSGVEFAFIRVGYRGYSTDPTKGKIVADNYYITNIKNAVKAGVNVGVYIYSQAITEQEAVEEAQFVLDRIKDLSVQMQVVLDYEYASTSSGTGGRLYEAKLSVKKATDICLAFCTAVENAGYQPMVYANRSMLQNQLDAARLSARCPIWLARYGKSTGYKGEYEFWQYTSSGEVPGMSGRIDCNFRYVWIEATGIDIPERELTVELDEEKKVFARLTPSNASNAIMWRSGDENIASVAADGTVTGVNTGTTTITASIGSLSASCRVTVVVPNVRGVVIEQDEYTITEGEQLDIKANVVPKRAGNRNIRWSSSNSSIVSVSGNGTIVGRSNGTATITATSEEGGFTDTATVKVLHPVTAVTLSETQVSVQAGETHRVTATVMPDNGEWKVTWSSSDSGVATVDGNGVITAVSVGTATITATAGGKSASATVNVTGRTLTVSTIVTLRGLQGVSMDGLSFRMVNVNNIKKVIEPEQQRLSNGAAFSISADEAVYDLRISMPGFTSYRNKSFEVGKDTMPGNVVLAPGDINGDDYVNIKDLAKIGSLIGTSAGAQGSGYSIDADFDRDGVIDTEDESLLLGSFAQHSTVTD